MLIAPYLEPELSEEKTYRTTYEQTMRGWKEAAFEEAVRIQRMNHEFDRVPEYIQCLEGTFWDRKRPRYLSSFVDNRLAHARYSTLSLLTDIRPTINVTSSVDAFKEQAMIAQGVIQSEWVRRDLDLALAAVIDGSMLFGNSFWKITANTPGEMNFYPCGPDVVMPINPGYKLQDSAAILFRTYKPLSYFQRIWPTRSYNLEREATTMPEHEGTSVTKPPHISHTTWSALSPQMRYRLGVKGGKMQGQSQKSGPVIELQEYWLEDSTINTSKEDVVVKDPYLGIDEHNYHYVVPPMGRLFPRKRLIVYAGNRLMYDGPSPYWHGLFPFSMLRLNPVMWSFWGLSKYRNQLPLNKAINEIGAGTMDACKRALNPQMIVQDNAVNKTDVEQFFPNMPGGKLRINPNANTANAIRYMEPPTLPAYVFMFLAQYLLPESDRMAGIMDTSRLTGKGQIPGGDTVEQLRDNANPAVRLEGRYIEEFLKESGRIAISNIFQFYTKEQRLKILGGAGLTWQDFDYKPSKMMVPDGEIEQEHWRKFSMEVSPGSFISSRNSEQQVAVKLFMIGAISRKELLRRMEVGNIDEIEQEVMKERYEGIGVDTLEGPGGAGSDGGRTPRMTRSSRNGNPM